MTTGKFQTNTSHPNNRNRMSDTAVEVSDIKIAVDQYMADMVDAVCETFAQQSHAPNCTDHAENPLASIDEEESEPRLLANNLISHTGSVTMECELQNRQPDRFRPVAGEAAADFYRRIKPELNRKELSELLGKPGVFWDEFRKTFVKTFDFCCLPIDFSLRTFVYCTVFPNEGQQIVRLVEEFSRRYFECNPTVFEDDGPVYGMAMGLIVLNTDFHHAQPTRKRSPIAKKKYLEQMLEVDAIKLGVSPFVLEAMYDRVRRYPLTGGAQRRADLPAEDGNDVSIDDIVFHMPENDVSDSNRYEFHWSQQKVDEISLISRRFIIWQSDVCDESGNGTIDSFVEFEMNLNDHNFEYGNGKVTAKQQKVSRAFSEWVRVFRAFGVELLLSPAAKEEAKMVRANSELYGIGETGDGNLVLDRSLFGTRKAEHSRLGLIGRSIRSSWSTIRSWAGKRMNSAAQLVPRPPTAPNKNAVNQQAGRRIRVTSCRQDRVIRRSASMLSISANHPFTGCSQHNLPKFRDSSAVTQLTRQPSTNSSIKSVSSNAKPICFLLDGERWKSETLRNILLSSDLPFRNAAFYLALFSRAVNQDCALVRKDRLLAQETSVYWKTSYAANGEHLLLPHCEFNDLQMLRQLNRNWQSNGPIVLQHGPLMHKSLPNLSRREPKQLKKWRGSWFVVVYNPSSIPTRNGGTDRIGSFEMWVYAKDEMQAKFLPYLERAKQTMLSSDTLNALKLQSPEKRIILVQTMAFIDPTFVKYPDSINFVLTGSNGQNPSSSSDGRQIRLIPASTRHLLSAPTVPRSVSRMLPTLQISEITGGANAGSKECWSSERHHWFASINVAAAAATIAFDLNQLLEEFPTWEALKAEAETRKFSEFQQSALNMQAQTDEEIVLSLFMQSLLFLLDTYRQKLIDCEKSMRMERLKISQLDLARLDEDVMNPKFHDQAQPDRKYIRRPSQSSVERIYNSKRDLIENAYEELEKYRDAHSRQQKWFQTEHRKWARYTEILQRCIIAIQHMLANR